MGSVGQTWGLDNFLYGKMFKRSTLCCRQFDWSSYGFNAQPHSVLYSSKFTFIPGCIASSSAFKHCIAFIPTLHSSRCIHVECTPWGTSNPTQHWEEVRRPGMWGKLPPTTHHHQILSARIISTFAIHPTFFFKAFLIRSHLEAGPNGALWAEFWPSGAVMYWELPLCSHMTPGSGLLTTVRIAHYPSDLRSRLRPLLMKQAVYRSGWLEQSLLSNKGKTFGV